MVAGERISPSYSPPASQFPPFFFLSPPLLSVTTKGVPGTQDSPALGAITGLAQPLCLFLMAIPPLGLAAAGKLSAKWASLFFCGVVELPISLNLLRAALVSSMVGIPAVLWAVCLESGKPEEGERLWLWKCLGGGAQRVL